ncbi:hypothetical protein CFI10_18820 [Marinobacterium iners]|nr:hypothetical protein CFI10_18820 [Marinobacterium iners]
MHAYPPALPKQVHLRCVPLTSYGFLQTLPLASNALASRIVFPSVRVTPPSFRWPGLPASPGKQKKAALRLLFACSRKVGYLPILRRICCRVRS